MIFPSSASLAIVGGWIEGSKQVWCLVNSLDVFHQSLIMMMIMLESGASISLANLGC